MSQDDHTLLKSLSDKIAELGTKIGEQGLPADDHKLLADIKDAVDQVKAKFDAEKPAPLDSDAEKAFNDIKKQLEALQTKVSPPAATPAMLQEPQKSAVTAILTELKAKLAEQPNPAPLADYCGPDKLKRGFQIMGPEGMHSFDQDSRLVMAMYTSAKPLTATLQEYSARVLQPKMTTSDQLLPLAREALKALAADRAIDRVQMRGTADGKPKTADILADILATFEGDTP